jgi:oligopeptide/dipeptide ABC transporter ATP-binding protein
MTSPGNPLLQVNNLYKQFPYRSSQLWGSVDKIVHAVDGVSFELKHGEALGLVGESGCGKSTLALTLMGLENPTRGTITFEGRDITNLPGSQVKEIRRRIQMVFQDPYETLNPLMTIGDLVAEPLKVHGLSKDKMERRARVLQALKDAGLQPPEVYLNRFPHQLSGGQRQRVVIAGALVLEPILLLADEPVSMLDVSIRAEILALLDELRKRRGISILFITHDLATAAQFTDRTAVMYLGRIVEIGPTSEVLQNPQHPYTRALLSVVPVPNPRLRRERVILQGETPNAVELPPGCRFHPRCPLAYDECQRIDPPLFDINGTHRAACLLVTSERTQERTLHPDETRTN